MASTTGRSRTAEGWREEGNRLFKQGQFTGAAECYGKAIIKRPDSTTFFTNRGLCYLKLERWQDASEDCRKAIHLDGKKLKAHYFLGQAQQNLGNLKESRKHLRAALDLAQRHQPAFASTIQELLGRVKRRLWDEMEDRRRKSEDSLHGFLTRLIADSQGDDTDSASWQEGELRKLQLEELLERAGSELQRREVPEHLCCKITFEVMQDPVITPEGITYERSALLEHLQRVGRFDPLTRTPLTPDRLIPNLAIKEAVTRFLQENPWTALFDTD